MRSLPLVLSLALALVIVYVLSLVVWPPTRPSAPTPARAARPRGPAGGRGRGRGFTLPELLICMALMATLAALAGPSMTGMRGANAVRGARGEVLATIEAARAAALQRGRRARVEVRGNTMVALVDDGSAKGFVVVATADLKREYRVELATAVPADTMVTFDPRGLAAPRLGHVARFVVRSTAGGARDSVCVSNLGLLLPPGCAP